MKIREWVDTLLTMLIGPKKEDIERVYAVRGYYKPKPSPSETIMIRGFSKKDRDGKVIPGDLVEQTLYVKGDPLDPTKFFKKPWEKKPKDFYTALEKWPDGGIRERRPTMKRSTDSKKGKGSSLVLILIVLLLAIAVWRPLIQDFRKPRINKRLSPTRASIVEIQERLLQRTKNQEVREPRLILSEDQAKHFEDPTRAARALLENPSLQEYLR